MVTALRRRLWKLTHGKPAASNSMRRAFAVLLRSRQPWPAFQRPGLGNTGSSLVAMSEIFAARARRRSRAAIRLGTGTTRMLLSVFGMWWTIPLPFSRETEAFSETAASRMSPSR